MAAKAAKNTSNIGFEKQIWDAACVLRGNMDASEYKSVVLGLIFLKYISDRFEAKYKELVEEGDGFEEDIDEYIETLKYVFNEAYNDPEKVKNAPYQSVCHQLDESNMDDPEQWAVTWRCYLRKFQ